MATIVIASPRQVSAVWGEAFVIRPGRPPEPLVPGDVVRPGDTITTGPTGMVELAAEAPPPSNAVTVAEFEAQNAPSSALAAIEAIERGDPDAAPAAGLQAGGDGSLLPGVRVERISELTFAGAGLEPLPGAAGQPAGNETRIAPENFLTAAAPSADSGSIDAQEEGGTVPLNLAPPSGNVTGIVVDGVPPLGEIRLPDGTVVTPGMTLTPEQLGGLTYVPPADVPPGTPPGSFTYTASGPDGRSQGTVTVNLAPVNDAPLAADDAATTREDTPVSGNVLANDSDVDGPALSVSGFRVAGSEAFAAPGSTLVIGGVGTLTVASDGSWTFTPAQDFAGTVPTFQVAVTDGIATDVSTLRVALTAANDAPVLADDTATTPKGTPATIAVLANDRDADGDTLTVTGATLADPTRGTVTVNADGTLNFVPAHGVTGDVRITYTVSDGQGATSTADVVVTVGANTPPTGADATLTIDEDGSHVFRAADFGFADADPGDTLAAVRIDTLPANGTLLLGQTPVTAGQVIPAGQLGTLVFVPAANANGSGYASFTFSVRDDAGAFDTTPNVLTVNVTAQPDAAVTGGTATGATVEDTKTSATGQLTVSDVDAGEAAYVPATIAGAHGTLAIGADGRWTYTLDNADPAVQALGAGDTLPAESFTVRTVDGTTQTVTVTITGTNDAAVVAGGRTGSVTEDAGVVGGNLVTGGALSVSDADAGEAVFVAQAGTPGTYGTFTVDASGNWTYSAANNNPAIQALGKGDTLTETFTVVTADGTTSSVTVTINGANDGASIAGVSSGSVTEDVGVVGGNLVTGGALTVSDVDVGESVFVAQAGTPGTYGAFTVDAAGNWSYTAANNNPAIQALGAGDTLTETFNVVTADGTTSSVTVTINGTNDGAQITGTAAGSVTEDQNVVGGNLATSGVLTVADPDPGESSFQAQAGTPGAYGTFTIDTSGSWTYTASNNNPAIQALGNGDTLTETFVVVTADGTPSSVTVTINGANDGATVAGVSSGSVTEDVGVVAGNLVTGGALTVSDVDTGESVFVAQAGTPGAYGTFTVDANGNWTYTAANNNPAIQALGNGDTLTETFAVVTADGTPSSVTVTINGANDGATIAGVSSGSVTEDLGVVGGNLVTGGALTVSDVDAGQAVFVAQAGTPGTYGTFTVDAAGNWTYTASNNDPAIQALGNGDTLTETFNVITADGTTSTVTITINGANDGASVAGVSSGNVTEDLGVVGGNLVTGGALTVSDVDTGEAVFVAQAGTPGTDGTFTVDAAGNWTYTAANSNPVIQALGAGDTLTETFSVVTADGTLSSVTVTINGTNDGASVAGVSSGSVTEDLGVVGGNLVTSGALTVSDVDTGEAVFTAQAGTPGTYGTFTVDAAGNWTYTALNSNPAIQALGAGDTLTETFAVVTADGTPSSVTVTINGANDGASVAGVSSGSVTEDLGVVGGNLVTGGALTVSDVDTGESVFVAQAGTPGTYGTFTVDASGNWTYTATNSDPAIQTLGAGDTLTETFAVVTADGTPSSVTITINGTNDGASVAGVSSGSVTEDLGVVGGNLVTGGALTVSDVDTGEAVFVAQAGTPGAYGTFTVDANGNWTYTALNSNAAIQALGNGDTLTETFNVITADGTPSTVTVTINGANDGASVAGVSSGSVTEDLGVVGGKLVTGGALTVSDVDTGESVFVAQAATPGTYGTFTVDANGNWTYTAANSNPAIQALGNGDTLTETFAVVTADGTPSSVTVTINGANDGASIAGVSSGSVTEDLGVVGGNLVTGGALTVSDVDTGEAVFVAQAATPGAYGTFTVDANGNWSYTAANGNPAIQALGNGDTLTETFAVVTADGTPSSVTVTINGANDGATITGVSSGSVTEDLGVFGGNLVTGGALTVTDPDAGESVFVAQAATPGTYGTFTVDANGNWTYTAANSNPAIQALGSGDTLTETFAVVTADGTPSAVTVTINGANDGAAIAGVSSGSVTEDQGVVGGNLVTGGALTVSDVDTGEAVFVAQAGTPGTYGTFTVDTSGNWTYTAANGNPAIQALVTGGTLTETFQVVTADGTPSSVTVTIRGTDDAPQITGPLTGTVAEDGTATATGKLVVTDADAGQSAFTPVSGASGTYGTFSIDATGQWTYNLRNGDANVQALAQNQSVTDSFTVTTADGTQRTVVVTVNGNNDAPTAVLDVASVSEGTTAAPTVVTGDVTPGTVGQDRDVDNGATITVAGVVAGTAASASGNVGATVAGTYGSLVVAADGSYTYTLDNTRAATNGLAAGQTAVEEFTVTVTDEFGATSTAPLRITITGTNDAPVAVADVATAVEAGGVANGTAGVAPSGNVLGNDSDPDAGDTRTVSAVSGTATGTPGGSTAGSYGTLVLQANGSYVYTVDDSLPAVQALRSAGTTLTDTFTYTVRDASGATSTATLTVTIEGRNDAPVAANDSANVLENQTASATALTGVLANDSDVDAGDTRTVVGVAFGAATGTVGSALAGTYGTLVLNADGSYSYAADRADALVANQVVTETFQVTVRDAAGATATSTLSFTVTGTNDAAVIGLPTVTTVTEDASPTTLTASGTISISDADAGEAAFRTTVNGVGSPLGTLTLAANGSYTYSVANSAVQFLGANQTRVDTFVVTALDGTTRQVSFTIVGTNDAPTITAGTANVSEEALAGANVEAADVGISTVASGKLTLADADAGSTLTASFGTPAAGLTSGGVAITWTTSNGGRTLVGSAGSTTILTATLTNAGDYTVTLSGPIDHAGAGEDVRSVLLPVIASDGTATGTSNITVNIADDSPVFTTTAGPADAVVTSGAGTVAVGDLNVAFGADKGAGARVNLAVATDANGFITTTTYDANGNAVGTSLLRYQGNALKATTGADGTLTAVDPLGTQVFTLTPDAASGRYTLNMLKTVDQVSVTATAFPTVVAGNASAYVFADGQANWNVSVETLAPNNQGVLQPSTVNTNNTTFGVGNASLDSNERLKFLFDSAVSGQDAPMTGIAFGLQGLGAGETVTWIAYNGAGTQVGTGVVTSGGSGAQFTTQTVLTAANFTGGTFSNIEFIGGANTSTQLLLNYASGGSDRLSQQIALTGTAVDADGDASGSAGFDIRFGAPAYGTLTGSDGENALAGGAGNQTLNGAGGDDILVGGKGDDSLIGGAGGDVFVWRLADGGTAGAPAIDRVQGFDTVGGGSAGGDSLDLRDLLVGEQTAGGANGLQAYLDFDTTTAAGSTVIRVSSTGGFTGGTYTAGAHDQSIVLEGVNLRAVFGLSAGSTDAQIIQELLNRQKLTVDG